MGVASNGLGVIEFAIVFKEVGLSTAEVMRSPELIPTETVKLRNCGHNARDGNICKSHTANVLLGSDSDLGFRITTPPVSPLAAAAQRQGRVRGTYRKDGAERGGPLS